VVVRNDDFDRDHITVLPDGGRKLRVRYPKIEPKANGFVSALLYFCRYDRSPTKCLAATVAKQKTYLFRIAQVLLQGYFPTEKATKGGATMKRRSVFVAVALLLSLSLALPLMAQEKKKAEKAKGDVGLLDLEKNYMILVTKEGKLITLDFNEKSKVTMLESKGVKMSEVGLGSSAEVEYQSQEDKKVLTNLEFRPAKGGE